MASLEAKVEKMDEYDFAWTASMKTILDSTASSCRVSASGSKETAPMVPWIVSSKVNPANTFIDTSRSSSVIFAHDCRSFDSGTFSGNQKFVVRRFQTSRSLSSSMWFQLMAWYVGMRCATSRSEERRVGKEGVLRTSLYYKQAYWICRL